MRTPSRATAPWALRGQRWPTLAGGTGCKPPAGSRPGRRVRPVALCPGEGGTGQKARGRTSGRLSPGAL
eukprot:10336892-Alexandrium_andersonii.AAC.1